MWNKTKINTTSQQQCPNGPPGVNALRECLTVKSLPKWGAVNDTKCNKWPKCSATTTGKTHLGSYYPKKTRVLRKHG